MSVYVLDANIVSFYLKENKQVIENIDRSVRAEDELIIDPIAYYEVRRGLLAIGSKRRMEKFEEFCDLFAVGKLNNDILDIAAEIYVELRRIGRVTGDSDILIAAYCKRHGFTLVTNNVKHFESITDLSIVDWTVVEQSDIDVTK